MLESQKEVEHILLSPLMKIGLVNVLVNLLAFEMSKLTNEKIPERYNSILSASKGLELGVSLIKLVFGLLTNFSSYSVFSALCSRKISFVVLHIFVFQVFKITHLIQMIFFAETDLMSIYFPTS